MKFIGTFKEKNGKEILYSFFAKNVIEAEKRAQEISKTFHWYLITWTEA